MPIFLYYFFMSKYILSRKCIIHYPAVFKYSTCDWFEDWPRIALESISQRLTASFNFPQETEDVIIIFKFLFLCTFIKFNTVIINGKLYLKNMYCKQDSLSVILNSLLWIYIIKVFPPISECNIGSHKKRIKVCEKIILFKYEVIFTLKSCNTFMVMR